MGSLVTITREGNQALLEVTNPDDMKNISDLLNALKIEWKTHRKETAFIPREKRYGPVLVVEFDFEKLETIMDEPSLFISET